MKWKCIAWDPDDCGVEEAREYTGSTPGDIAKQHAERMHAQGDQQEEYNIRVRAAKGAVIHEWDVSVDVEIEVSFHASITTPVSPSASTSPQESMGRS